jgi:gliding motility-associated-like protein
MQISKIISLLIIILILISRTFAQNTPSAGSFRHAPERLNPQAFFTGPDTTCVGMPVTFVKGPGGSQFYWNFCTANTIEPPFGNNFGNNGNKMKRPKFITLIKDSGNYHCFITNPGNQSIVRTDNGPSLGNPPASTLTLFTTTLLSDKMRGIQIVLDSISNHWVGFFTAGNSMTRLVFPGGLSKNPTVLDVSLPGMSAASGLVITKEGQRYIGLVVDSLDNSIYRLRFDSSLLKIPDVDPLGNLGNLNGPTGICLVKENGQNYLFVCNSGSSTLSRVDFGMSLLDQAAGLNLGNIGGLDHNTGISIIADCGHINGIVTNNAASAQPLIQLNFQGGSLGGNLSGTPVGPPCGSPSQPFGISEMVRIADTVYCFYLNDNNSTLSQLYFPPCNAAIPPSSMQPDPGTVVYSSPGDYNVILREDEGSPNPGSFCRPIHVLPELTVNLGGDRFICQGIVATLNAGNGYSSYLWSTGETSALIQVSDSGKYWVRVSNRYGCTASDTVFVHKSMAPVTSIDTTICYGEKYFAGGKYQTQSGIYTDTLSMAGGCDSIVITNLNVRPKINVMIGHDTVLCPGGTYMMDATTAGATAYQWQDGSTGTKYTASGPGIYWVHVAVNNCVGGDTVRIEVCPYVLTFPSAFTPNNDGLNDTFRPVGISIGSFHMEIYDRWGMLMFSTDDINQGWNGIFKNQYSPAGVYVYDVTFETQAESGTKKKAKGTFTLIR